MCIYVKVHFWSARGGRGWVWRGFRGPDRRPSLPAAKEPAALPPDGHRGPARQHRLSQATSSCCRSYRWRSNWTLSSAETPHIRLLRAGVCGKIWFAIFHTLLQTFSPELSEMEIWPICGRWTISPKLAVGTIFAVRFLILFPANQWESRQLLSQSVSVSKVAWSNIWPLGFSHILEGIMEGFCRLGRSTVKQNCCNSLINQCDSTVLLMLSLETSGDFRVVYFQLIFLIESIAMNVGSKVHVSPQNELQSLCRH